MLKKSRTILVDEDVWKALTYMKASLGERSYSQVIRKLLESSKERMIPW